MPVKFETNIVPVEAVAAGGLHRKFPDGFTVHFSNYEELTRLKGEGCLPDEFSTRIRNRWISPEDFTNGILGHFLSGKKRGPGTTLQPDDRICDEYSQKDGVLMLFKGTPQPYKPLELSEESLALVHLVPFYKVRPSDEDIKSYEAVHPPRKFYHSHTHNDIVRENINRELRHLLISIGVSHRTDSQINNGEVSN